MDEIWPSPTARRLRMKRRSAPSRSVWSGCATIEGLNKAADSIAYSPENRLQPIAGDSQKEKCDSPRTPVFSQSAAATTHQGLDVDPGIQRGDDLTGLQPPFR